VTSEQFEYHGRRDPVRYTVRVIDLKTGEVETHPNHDTFQKYSTLENADIAARLAALEQE